jgi:hypothetical protein
MGMEYNKRCNTYTALTFLTTFTINLTWFVLGIVLYTSESS